MARDVAVESYEENGFLVIRKAAVDSDIDWFINNYEPSDYEFIESRPYHDNYLDGRFQFVQDEEILKVLFSEPVLEFMERYKKKFLLHLVEARVGTSGIPWHRDDIERIADAAPEYMGIHVAMEKSTIDGGMFEIIPGSHRWILDDSVINQKNCSENCWDCYKYYEQIIELKNIDSYYSFEAEKADVIIWNGKSVHRGVQARDWQKSRRSMFAHLTSVSDQEASNLETFTGQKLRRYRGSVYLLEQESRDGK
jgi:hypothetical protein